MTDIFFSYSSKDRDRVEVAHKALTERGFDLFWDLQVPAGIDWDRWIHARLDQSRCVIVFWSANSAASGNVRHEVAIAREQGKLLQVLLEPLTTRDLPMGALAEQAVRLMNWRGARSDTEWIKLITAIEEKATPGWVRHKADEFDIELRAERHKVVEADGKVRILEEAHAREVAAQGDLRRQRDKFKAERDELLKKKLPWKVAAVIAASLAVAAVFALLRPPALEELQARLANEKTSRQQAETEVQQLRAGLEAMRREVGENEGHIAKLSQQREEALAGRSQAEAALTREQNRGGQSETEARLLRSGLEAERSKAKENEALIETLSKQRREAQAERKAAQDALAEEQTKSRQSETVARLLRTELEAERNKTNENERRIARLSQQHEEAQAELKQLQDALTKERAGRKDLSLLLEQANEKLKALIASREQHLAATQALAATTAAAETKSVRQLSTVVFYDSVMLKKDQEKQYDEIGVKLALQSVGPRQVKVAVNHQGVDLAFGERKVFRSQDVECELNLLETNTNRNGAQARVSISCKR